MLTVADVWFADVCRHKFSFSFFVDLICYFCLKYWVKRINRFCSSCIYIYMTWWLSFHGFEKVSYSLVDCCRCDDDTSFPFSFFVDLKCYFCLKYWVKRINRFAHSECMILLLLFLLSFQGLYHKQKENNILDGSDDTNNVIFTQYIYTQFHVKNRLTSTESCIHHTVHLYIYINSKHWL